VDVKAYKEGFASTAAYTKLTTVLNAEDKAAMEAFKENGAQGPDSPFEKIFEPGEIPAFTEPGTYYLAVYFDAENYEMTDIEYFTFELTAPAPETGDTFNLGLWLAVAALTAAAGIVLVLRRKEQA
jgi:LPXTG-motif cell wall-anchored protein